MYFNLRPHCISFNQRKTKASTFFVPLGGSKFSSPSPAFACNIVQRLRPAPSIIYSLTHTPPPPLFSLSLHSIPTRRIPLLCTMYRTFPSSHGAPATVAQLGKYCTEAGGKSRLAGLPLERGKRKTNNHFWKRKSLPRVHMRLGRQAKVRLRKGDLNIGKARWRETRLFQ